VRILDTQPCQITGKGGVCSFSAQVLNRSAERLNGAAWANIHAFGTGSFLGYTQFTIDPPRKLSIPSEQSQTVKFSFQIPNTVSPGAEICVDLFVGEGKPNPFFNTLGEKVLFCIRRDASGYTLLAGRQALDSFQRLQGGPSRPAAIRP
jgi:hypothetical protein